MGSNSVSMQPVMRLFLSLCAGILAMYIAACGGGTTAQLQAPQELIHPTSWPTGLPQDRLQPWEQLDSNGQVIPNGRSASGINQDSDFTPGIEHFTAVGDVSDNGEALHIASTSGTVSHALYRIPLGGAQPGVVSVDANLLSGKGYYIGLADYGSSRWNWHGPFTDNHVRISTAGQGTYTSSLGNLFVCLLVHDTAAADLVGIAVNSTDTADAVAPDQPAGLSATPLAGGLSLSWDPVIAGDLAGYRIYHSDHSFISGTSARVEQLDSLEGLSEHILPAGSTRHVRISAVDISGNESMLSDIFSAAPLAGPAPALKLTVDKPSGALAEGISITATGADSYDFDLDGDGTYDITGNTTGTAQVDTGSLGIIRPRVKATGTESTAIAHGSVSVVISGNSRPVAVAMSDISSGDAPLDVSFKWSFTTGADIRFSSPAFGADGTVYIGSLDNNIYAINADDSLKWSFTTGGFVDSSPAIGADGTVYVGSYDNKLYAFGP